MRTASARQQAELYLGQAKLGRVDGDSVVRAHSHFEPAAEGGAVDGGNDRFRAVLHRLLCVGQRGALSRSAELGDVGPGDEGAAFTDQDDGIDGIVGGGRGDTL